MVAHALTRQWDVEVNPPGVITASLLVVLLVATIVGGLTGLIFGNALEPVILAIVAGFLGTVVASVIRNTLLVSAWGYAGIADAGTPVPIVVKAATASLAGSLAADRLALIVGDLPSIVLGGLAGLLSAVLLGLLMIAYRMTPDHHLAAGK